MQLGLIGLGKMGGNMAERLHLGGHQVVGFDFNPEAVSRLTASGNVGASSLEEMAKRLTGRKAVWIMVPQGKPVDETIAKLEPLLNKGDILIDGGNSNYKDSQRHYKEVTAKGFQFVDVGTSGGVWGLKEGYSMMVGGPDEAVNYLRPIFETLAPAKDQGWGHVGPAGAGHYQRRRKHRHGTRIEVHRAVGEGDVPVVVLPRAGCASTNSRHPVWENPRAPVPLAIRYACSGGVGNHHRLIREIGQLQGRDQRDIPL